MLTLRALSMEKVVTENLSPDSYPQTLLEEIQTLKKLYNIGLSHHSCWNKQQLLDVSGLGMAADGLGCLQIACDGCRWLQMVGDDNKWLVMTANG